MFYVLAFVAGWLCSVASLFALAYMTKPINAGRESVQHISKKLYPTLEIDAM